ncbi:MAG: GatB/YqeY domain-containing protein [Bacilli bacterium]|jgi:hypothetical protein
MLINELEKANMDALKSKNKDERAILSVVINNYRMFAIEAKANGKEVGDADVIRVIQKTLKELDDEKQGYLAVNNKDRVHSIEVQEATIKRYLPKMMSEDEIRKVIEGLKDKSIPNIMKAFKSEYAGKCDMSAVSRIAREFQ